MSLELYSNPSKVLHNAKAYLGQNVQIKPSTRKGKKYMLYDTNHSKWIHFGAMGYEDYTKHNDKKRRDSYLSRSTKIKGDWSNNKYSANNLSIHILWAL